MPTQSKRRRTREILESLAGFPPEGISEPFKLTPYTWTRRFPFGVGGENRNVPADSLAPDEGFLISNWRLNRGDAEPEWGYSELGSPKGTPLEIININLYKELDGTSRLIRMDEDELHHWAGSSWSQVAGNGDAMSGDQDDTIRSAMAVNQFIWVNGVDAPKTWAVGDALYSDLTADVNAPSTARHVVSFADRVVFADIGTGANRNPQRLEWSASGDATDFTTLGAGGVTLFDSQTGAASDDIAALKVFSNFLVVLRQRSVWLGLRTGNAETPIQFSSHAQGTGVLAPDSVQTVGSLGLCFLGNDNVYLYNPQSKEPVPIGDPIKDRIFALLDRSKPEKVKSAYVADTNEYWLIIPDSNDTWATNGFILDLARLQSENKFVWRERDLSQDPVTAAFGGQTSGLGGTFTNQETKLVFGSDGGEAFEIDDGNTNDDGTDFTAEFQSPQFTAGNRDVDLRRVNLAYTAGSAATVTIAYSVDGGDNWTNSASYALSASTAVREAGIWVPSGIYGRAVMFRLRAESDQDVNIAGYRIAFATRGEIRTT